MEQTSSAIYRDHNGISERIKHRTSEILRSRCSVWKFSSKMGSRQSIFRAQCRYWYWSPRRSYSTSGNADKKLAMN